MKNADETRLSLYTNMNEHRYEDLLKEILRVEDLKNQIEEENFKLNEER